MIVAAIATLLVFATTAALTGVVRRRSLATGRLDIPNVRSSHTTPTPTGGGVSIVLVFYIAVSMLAAFGLWSETFTPTLAALAVCGLIVAVAGYVDDKRPLAPGVRLVVHLVAATAMVYTVGTPALPLPFALPWWPATALTVLAVVWCLNLFNFMDGIDGIAAVEAITVGAAAACIAWVLAPEHPAWLLLTALTAATGGFLVWNMPPAKVFMGDAASGFIGFSIAAFAVWTTVDGVMNIYAWLILPAAFFVDATVTLARRLGRRERIHEAHRSHAYQCMVRLLQYAYGARYAPGVARAAAHRRVSLLVGAVNLLWLAPLATVAVYKPEWGALLTMLAWAPLVAGVFSSQNAERELIARRADLAAEEPWA